MKRTFLSMLLAVAAIAVSCNTKATKDEENADGSFKYDVTYEYLPGNFANPERGSYSGRQLTFKDGKMTGLVSPDNMRAVREDGCSLIYTGIYLCDFMDGPISDDALAYIRKHFDNLRQSGCKAVLRFAYSWVMDGGIQNPPLDIILTHISQVKPILQEYVDVIYILQAGFIGPWGEWHSYSYVDDDGKKAILLAELDALPESREVAVRTAAAKRKVFGTFASDTITVATAFNGSDYSRVAGHNDCFLASNNDVGTYNSASDKIMWKTESLYTAMGGESCYVDGTDAYCQCERAYQELEDLHWSYLSNHSSIAAIWKVNGCNDDINSRVGYRFTMNGSAFYGAFRSGNEFTIRMSITNYGFASLINERKMEFIVENAADPAEKYVYVSETDPRIWKGGNTYTHSETITLPETLKSGEKYNIYIAMPDVAKTLHDIPEYSVRFANKGVWDASQGYNLMATVVAK